MALVKWDPFRDILSFQDRMSRLFEDMMGKRFEEGVSLTTWTPPVDIYETDSDIVLKAELPGVKIQDVDLQVRDNLLVVRGERKFEKDVKEENYHRIERVYGSFQRAFTLPTLIRQDGIKATLKDGILEVILPKAEVAKPRQIKIES